MEDVIEINWEKACRLCLTTDEIGTSIFDEPLSSVPLADKIKNCTSIKVRIHLNI